MDQNYDVITMWDVIEHLEHPRKAMAEIRDHLETGGFLFVSTPDSSSLMAKMLGRRWYHLDPEQHLNIFSRKNLRRFLTEFGFTIIKKAHIGHYYRMDYVLNKLGRTFKIFGSPSGSTNKRISIRRLRFYLKAFDVQLLVARKAS